MESKIMQQARDAVLSYVNDRRDFTTDECISYNDIYIVWFCKTLKNWKALVSTTIPDGMYYEVTFNGDNGELYLDAYRKWENIVIYTEDGG